MGIPGGSAGKESACNARDLDLIPGSGRSLEEGWQPPPVFLPGKSPWTEEAGGLQSVGLQRVGHCWGDVACTHTHSVAILAFACREMGSHWRCVNRKLTWADLNSSRTPGCCVKNRLGQAGRGRAGEKAERSARRQLKQSRGEMRVDWTKMVLWTKWRKCERAVSRYIFKVELLGTPRTCTVVTAPFVFDWNYLLVCLLHWLLFY